MWWRSHGTPDKHPAFHSPIPGWDRTDPDFSPLRGSGDSSSRRSIDTGEPADSVPIPSEEHNFLLSRQQRHSFRPAVYNDLWLRDRLHSPPGHKDPVLPADFLYNHGWSLDRCFCCRRQWGIYCFSVDGQSKWLSTPWTSGKNRCCSFAFSNFSNYSSLSQNPINE